MVSIKEKLNAYKEANGTSRANMAREIGLPERRLRSIMTEGREPDDLEEFIILQWLDAQHFDYIPPKTEEASKTMKKSDAKKVPAKKNTKAEAIGIRGDARVLVQMYREAMGFKTDTDAATYIVKQYFANILKEAANEK